MTDTPKPPVLLERRNGVLLIPPTRALEILLTGEPFDAVQAHDLGLLNRLVGPGEAVAAAKRVVREGADWPLAEAFARQDEIAQPIRESNDAREGALAFAEKRAPRWSGS